jgi:hypothetical protein
MSAIGSYEVVTRAQFARCLEAARRISTETTGKWLFKASHTHGTTEFIQAWQAAVQKRAVFDYSGYVLGNYIDAQRVINSTELVDEHSDVARLLARAFTAAFVFDRAVPLPDLPDEPLRAYCRDEYGAEGADLIEPIGAAHEFFGRGLSEISAEALVVFVIS